VKIPRKKLPDTYDKILDDLRESSDKDDEQRFFAKVSFSVYTVKEF